MPNFENDVCFGTTDGTSGSRAVDEVASAMRDIQLRILAERRRAEEETAKQPAVNSDKLREKREEWGDTDVPHECLHSFAHWLLDTVWYKYLRDEPRLNRVDYRDVLDYVRLFNPAPSKERSGMLALWPNRAAYDVGPAKRLRGKPGKMIRRMFPFIEDRDLEKMVDHYNDNYVFAEANYKLKTGMDAGDFAHAYSHDMAPTANMATTSYRKSLANSCMRYKFDSLDQHPCEAYASGDFIVVWVETIDGQIAARCVVSVPAEDTDEVHIGGPIYGVNDIATNLVENYIRDELKGRPFEGNSDRDNWIGKRLVAHEYTKGDGWVAPYLDLWPAALNDEGDYLVIDPRGSISATDYQGVLGGHINTCAHCGDHTSSEELTYVDGVGDVCDCCLDDNYVHCSRYAEWVDADGSQGVFTRGWMGGYTTETWGEHAVDHYAVETVSGELWSIEYVHETADGDFISERDLNDGDWSISDWDGQIYFSDDMVTVEGELVHCDEVDADLYKFNENTGEWEQRDAA